MNANSGADNKRILQIAHNHPQFHAGGTELTALALHREALRLGFDSWYLGALDETQVLPNEGTHMIALSSDQREAALFTNGFRRFDLAQTDSFGFLRELHEYLAFIRPNVIHLHHVLNFGLESLFVIRSALPKSKILLTLHDYYLICPNNGQLFKHDRLQRCDGPAMTECLKCFPKRSANELRMRHLNIENALTLCDELISPSFFLKEKVEAYLNTKREIKVVENGYLGSISGTHASPAAKADIVTFGYFGNISAVKGLSDFLEAADILLKRGITNFRISIHGSQLFEDRQLSSKIDAAKEGMPGQVRFFGQYRPDQIADLMAGVDCVVFPSIWWENAPLVVYEALHHGRQVISYPHGGAPEILSRYGAGVFAQETNPHALANAIAEIITNPEKLSYTLTRPLPGKDNLFNRYRALYFDTDEIEP